VKWSLLAALIVAVALLLVLYGDQPVEIDRMR
jgi:hypothetical protein